MSKAKGIPGAKPETCNPANRAALDLQLRRIRKLEETSKVYKEMCEAADARVAARLPSNQSIAAQKARQALKEMEA